MYHAQRRENVLVEAGKKIKKERLPSSLLEARNIHSLRNTQNVFDGIESAIHKEVYRALDVTFICLRLGSELIDQATNSIVFTLPELTEIYRRLGTRWYTK